MPYIPVSITAYSSVNVIVDGKDKEVSVQFTYDIDIDTDDIEDLGDKHFVVSEYADEDGSWEDLVRGEAAGKWETGTNWDEVERRMATVSLPEDWEEQFYNNLDWECEYDDPEDEDDE